MHMYVCIYIRTYIYIDKTCILYSSLKMTLGLRCLINYYSNTITSFPSQI